MQVMQNEGGGYIGIESCLNESITGKAAYAESLIEHILDNLRPFTTKLENEGKA
jgi:hypothetical protein